MTKFHSFPWNPNVLHCLQNISPVSETDESTHTMLLYCFNIYLNVILPSTPKYPKWSPSFVFVLKLSVNFTSISLPRTSHICNLNDQNPWEVSWPRNSAPYMEYQYSFLCSMIISWARWIEISPSQHSRFVLILSSIYNYILQKSSSPQNSRLKLHVYLLSRRKGFWGVLSSLSKPIMNFHKNHVPRWMGEWMDEYNASKKSRFSYRS
jgi:hypothetical protein